MTKPLTKEQLAEMRERFMLGEYTVEDVQDVFERLDSHALVNEALDLATAKLATATACDKCGIPGEGCPHCTNGVVISDERARELLQKAKERDAAYDYGSRLLKCIWPEETHPDFEVLPDMLGLMTQLDHALAARAKEGAAE